MLHAATENVTCSAMFIEQNGSCVPGCLQFTTMDHRLSVFWRIGLIVLLVLGEIAALGVIVTFMVDRRKMYTINVLITVNSTITLSVFHVYRCQYPLLYVLYVTILWIIFGEVINIVSVWYNVSKNNIVLLVLIGRFHPQLFCQHESLLTNKDNPTVFCLVTGNNMESCK